GRPATEIAAALLRLGTLGLPRDWSPAHGLDTRQAETLRKMLLAVVSDPRLVLARLAEELVALRQARELPGAERARRALEARAVRVVVASVPECYGALGIVHGQWPYIPGEFDDYIATPKGNGYRSIHTAVIGPQGRSLEVQIRTPQMHEHAELGVAAHWTYKEGGPRDAHYQRKIEWVRRLLEPQDGREGGAEADRDLIEGMRTELFADRVYVLTPKIGR